MTSPLHDPENLRRAQDIFRSVCDLETSEQLIGLDRACGSDVGLRSAVEALLLADRSDDDPLADRAIDSHDDHPIPDTIGAFRVIREIGRGGMGIVYEAQQHTPSRRVALKLVRPERPTKTLRARLRREAEVLALLQHPGIAQVFQTGEHEGIAYIAMELVDGEPILEAGRRLSLRGRVDLMIRVIDAVHHAHQKGVIHRDLKPENVLVVSRPSGELQPKVVDFGIARATEEVNRATLAASLTLEHGGSLLGTLAYMSPEQLEGGNTADVRSDVYALGMIAYALLTGEKAIDLDGLPVAAAVRAVVNASPARAGLVNANLRGDLETILAKAIDADRERRYQSAVEFAGDLRRHLDREPISARPPSVGYVMGRVISRNKGLFAGLLLAFVAVIGGGVASLLFAASERRLRAEAESLLYTSALTNADRAIAEHEYLRAERLLAEAPRHLRGWEWDAIASRIVAPTAIASTGIRYGSLWNPGPAPGETTGAVWMLTGITDRGIETRTVIGSVETPGIIDPGFDATTVHAVARASTPTAITNGGHLFEIYATDLETGAADPIDPPSHNVPIVSLEPGDAFACVVVGEFAVYRTEGHQRVTEIVEHPTKGRVFAAVSYRSEGGRYRTTIVSAETRKVIARAETRAQTTVHTWSADGTILFSGHFGGRVSCIDPAAGTEALWGSRMVDSTHCRAIAISPDDRTIACSFDSGRTVILDGRTGLITRSYSLPGETIHQLIFDDVEEAFIGVSHSGGVFRFPAQDPPGVLRGHAAAVNPICVLPGGDRLLSGSWDGDLRLWEIATESTQLVVPITDQEGARLAVLEIAASPDGGECTVVATGGMSLPPTVVRIDLRTGREIDRIVASQSGRIVPFYTPDRALHLFAETVGYVSPEAVLHERMFGSFATSPPTSQHPSQIAFTDHRGSVIIRSVSSEKDVRAFAIFEGPVGAIALSPDGQRVCVADRDSAFRIYNATSGELLADLKGHTGEVLGAAWSPDGLRLATASRDGTIGIWDGLTHRRLATLSGHSDYVFALRWGEDGSRLFSSSGDGTIRIWGRSVGRLTP
jgi:WD40 repeat protein